MYHTCTILSMKLEYIRVNSLPDRRLVACFNPVRTRDGLKCTIAEVAPDGSTSVVGTRVVKHNEVDVVMYVTRFSDVELVYGDFQSQARIRYTIEYPDRMFESDPVTVGPIHGGTIVASATLGHPDVRVEKTYTRFEKYVLLNTYGGSVDRLDVAASLARFYEYPVFYRVYTGYMRKLRETSIVVPLGEPVTLGIVYGGRNPIVAEIRNLITNETITKCILGVKP